MTTEISTIKKWTVAFALAATVLTGCATMQVGDPCSRDNRAVTDVAVGVGGGVAGAVIGQKLGGGTGALIGAVTVMMASRALVNPCAGHQDTSQQQGQRGYNPQYIQQGRPSSPVYSR